MAHDVSETKPIGTKCKLRIRRERFDKNGKTVSEIADDLTYTGRTTDIEYAVVVNQIFDEKHMLKKEIMTINSPQILRVFKLVIGSYPTVGANFEEAFEMTSPYMMLYHKWAELDEYRNSCEDDAERMHLNVLFDSKQSF